MSLHCCADGDGLVGIDAAAEVEAAAKQRLELVLQHGHACAAANEDDIADLQRRQQCMSEQQ